MKHWDQLQFNVQIRVLQRIQVCYDLEKEIGVKEGLKAAIKELETWSKSPFCIANEQYQEWFDMQVYKVMDGWVCLEGIKR